MDCRDFLSRYSEYDDSLLSAAELELFHAHLSRCESCSRYDRVLRKGRMLARQHAPLQGSADFMPRLQRRLWQDRSQRRPTAGTAAGGLATGLAGVTVVVTAFVAVTLLDQRGSPAGEATAVPVAESPVQAPSPGATFSSSWGVLPVLDRPPERDWTTRRVDPRVPVAYSPLVTGPPAYRVSATFPSGATISTRHTLD